MNKEKASPVFKAANGVDPTGENEVDLPPNRAVSEVVAKFVSPAASVCVILRFVYDLFSGVTLL